MHVDRFEENKVLYIVGIVCLVLSLILGMFSFYCLPYLIWDLHYSVPLIVIYTLVELQDVYGYSYGISALIVFALMFIPALILAIISTIISKYIESKFFKNEFKPITLEGDEFTPEEAFYIGPEQPSLSIFSKILMTAAIVLVILFTVEWLISVPDQG